MTYTFFTDRDLGKRFPATLADAGLSVERHQDHFPHDCPDEVWLKEVGARGWIAVTHDRRIRYKPTQKAAVMQNSVALLVVVGHAPLSELADSFVATTRRIFAFLDKNDPPFIAKVYRPTQAETVKSQNAAGSIELWYPKAD